MYESTFPTHPELDAHLREQQRMIAQDETAQDMVSRIVGALETADARLDPDGAPAFAEQLGWALDTERIVFSTPIMTNAGRHRDRPLAACAVQPVDLRGDLAQVKAIVDDYHRAGMGTGFTLDDVDDPVTVLRYLNGAAVAGANSGAEDRPRSTPDGHLSRCRTRRRIEFIGCARSAPTLAARHGSSTSACTSPTRRCAPRSPGLGGSGIC